MKVNKFELAPFTLNSLGARGDVTVWLKPNMSFEGGNKIKNIFKIRIEKSLILFKGDLGVD